MLEKEMNLCAVALEGYWNDIGSIEAYYQTQFDLLEGINDLQIKPCCVVGEDIFLENAVELDESVEVDGPVYIGEGV